MLKAPLTEKELENGVSTSPRRWPSFGMAAMQGWRLRMEDAHVALPDFDVHRRTSLFGVFDGHGGAAVAQVVSERLPKLLLQHPKYMSGKYGEALYEVFFEMDRVLDSAPVRKDIVARKAQCPPSEDETSEAESGNELGHELLRLLEEGGESELAAMEDSEEEQEELLDAAPPLEGGVHDSSQLWLCGEGPDSMGTTAVVVLLCKDSQELFVANAGDSRCVLISGSGAADLSEDHKPILKAERMRIRKAGGFVVNQGEGGRVDGNLSLSRALGDLAYKGDKRLRPTEQKITCEPEVRHHRLTLRDSHLLLGCDGIWEKASSQQVSSFVLARLARTSRNARMLSSACADFLDANLARSPMSDMGAGCDNMTLMLVDLRGRAAFKQTSRRNRVADKVMRCSRSHRSRQVLRWLQKLKRK